MEAAMSLARQERSGKQPKATGDDALTNLSISDYAGTVPQHSDFVCALRISAGNRNDIVITSLVQESHGYGLLEPDVAAGTHTARMSFEIENACHVRGYRRPVDSMSFLAAPTTTPEEENRSFADHLARAALAYLAAHYKSLQTKPRSERGGLAPWQERQAKAMMTTDLSGKITLSEIAAVCRLSVSHFSSSFKRSVGYSPHRWLVNHRIERAKYLMVATRHPLCEIALETGFADQSHLTRVFSRYSGTSPAAWRRQHAMESPIAFRRADQIRTHSGNRRYQPPDHPLI
jgi:AraC-like DNA-binding protein